LGTSLAGATWYSQHRRVMETGRAFGKAAAPSPSPPFTPPAAGRLHRHPSEIQIGDIFTVFINLEKKPEVKT